MFPFSGLGPLIINGLCMNWPEICLLASESCPHQLTHEGTLIYFRKPSLPFFFSQQAVRYHSVSSSAELVRIFHLSQFDGMESKTRGEVESEKTIVQKDLAPVLRSCQQPAP